MKTPSFPPFTWVCLPLGVTMEILLEAMRGAPTRLGPLLGMTMELLVEVT